MLGQVVGNGAQLEALATAIQDHLGWLRRARARQADADALKIEDKDQYSSLVE